MATIASKIQWTTAAFAVAAAATLVPVAFADPTEPEASDTGSAAVGSSAGQAPTRSTRKDRSRVNDDAVAGQTGDSDSAGGASAGSGDAAGGATGNTSQGRASTNVTTPSATQPRRRSSGRNSRLSKARWPPTQIWRMRRSVG